MTRKLSDYLQSLEPDREPTLEAYEEAREDLRSMLSGELRRRHLWTSPPRYLGLLSDRWPGEAIDELVSECYVAICVDRLGSLKNQMLVGRNIDGLLSRCVRNFVHERQQNNDPLGYKIYQLVSKGLLRLAGRGALRVQPEGKIFNHTVCAFGGIPGEVPPVDFGDAVGSLNDDLWPELIVAQGAARSGLDQRLDEHLAGLEVVAQAFAFRDLIEPMKRDLRARWRDGVAAELKGFRAAESDVDLRDLRDCVRRLIESEAVENRASLLRLWTFLCDYAVGTNPSPVAEKAENSGRPPTDLGLEKALGESRHRISGYKRTLGKMVERCGFAGSGKRAVSSGIERGFTAMSRHQELREATGRALAAWAAARREVEAARRPVCPGDLFVFPGSDDMLIEWLVIGQGAKGHWSVLPADDGSGVGSCDVAISRKAGGSLTVRCAMEALLRVEVLASGRRTGALDPDDLARVEQKRQSVEGGSASPSSSELEVDEDPSYRHHLQELERLRDVLIATSNAMVASASLKEVSRSVSSFRRERVKRRLWAVAAMLLLGLGTFSVWQQGRITALRKSLEPTPYSNLPLLWLTAEEPPRGPEDAFVVPAEARHVAFVLEVSSPIFYPRYRVEVERQSPRQEVWVADDLIESGSEVSFELPLSLISSGHYEIRVHGLPKDGEPALLETYSLWIEMSD